MLVAATAMFFAVASSAFILRARMVECSMVPGFQPAPVVVDVATPATVTSVGAECGEALYESNPDGSVSVYFELCPPPGQTLVIGESAVDTPVAAPPAALPKPVKGVAVGRIVY